MTKEAIKDATILRNELRGENLKKLLRGKKLSKYRVAKAVGVSWRTLYNWEKGVYRPTEKNAILLARYLGLLAPDDADLLKLKSKIDDLQSEYERLSNKSQKERR